MRGQRGEYKKKRELRRGRGDTRMNKERRGREGQNMNVAEERQTDGTIQERKIKQCKEKMVGGVY